MMWLAATAALACMSSASGDDRGTELSVTVCIGARTKMPEVKAYHTSFCADADDDSYFS